MKLWHQALIRDLPDKELLEQHRTCCVLKRWWGRPERAHTSYVFNYTPAYLSAYHYFIMQELKRREFKTDPLYEDPAYRGSNIVIPGWSFNHFILYYHLINRCWNYEYIYPEHNDIYLKECLDALEQRR